jgi:hypothetical protein
MQPLLTPKLSHVGGVHMTNNRLWIRWLNLLVLLYNYTQLQPLITAHSRWLPKACSIFFCDYERLLFHCGWLIIFFAVDQFTLSLIGSLSDLSLIPLANCSPFIKVCELRTEHLIQWFLFLLSVKTVCLCMCCHGNMFTGSCPWKSM